MSDSEKQSSQDSQQKLADLEKQLDEVAKQEPAQASVKSDAKAEAKKVNKPAPKETKSSPPTSSRRSQQTRGTVVEKKAKTGALWFISLVNLLLIIAALGPGYWFWQQWQNQQNEQQNQALQKLQQLAQSQQQDKQSASRARQGLEQNIAALENENTRLTELIAANRQQITDVSGRRPADWLLAEAEYLTRMAGRKLWLEHDIRTAILMLKAADSRLQDLADPSLLPVRELIANDIQTLKQINPVSHPSVALAISALIKQVPNLPLATIKLPEVAEPEVDTIPSESVADWKENLQKTWRSFFTDSFKTYRVDTPLSPYMSEQQQWLAREQLKHALVQAKTAVLQEHSALYQAALQQAVTSLVENYKLEQAEVAQFAKGVKNLIETDIERRYPEQLTAIEPLKDLLQSRVDAAFLNEASAP